MAVTEVTVDGVVFPPVVACPPGSGRKYFLAGGGVRGLETGEGNFLKIAAMGVYLEDAAVPALARKWAGKTADELASDPDFFRDIHEGEFEKFTRVTSVLPRAVPGEEFAARVAESRVAYLKATGSYTDAEAAAVEEFKAAFRAQTLAPGGSVFFTHSPAGVLTVAFSEDSSVPELATEAIGNKALCEAMLESIIGERGVSPATKKSIAARMPGLLKAGAELQGGPCGPQTTLRLAQLKPIYVFCASKLIVYVDRSCPSGRRRLSIFLMIVGYWPLG